jgi:soluble lytic murein transglycosylase-like protein
MRDKEPMITTSLTKVQFYVLLGVFSVLLGMFFAGVTKSKAVGNSEPVYVVEVVDTPIQVPEAVEEELYVHPFAEAYEQGFNFYKIPEEYANEGGYLSEAVQVYLWNLCRDRGLDYYTVLALIERESAYKWDAVGDNENSYGYGQIYKKWHLERMEEEGVQDLTDPYGNLRVCTNFLQELQGKYGESGDNCVLMVYNMGESTAKKLWKQGIYSSEYSRGILQRAQELKQELQD